MLTSTDCNTNSNDLRMLLGYPDGGLPGHALPCVLTLWPARLRHFLQYGSALGTITISIDSLNLVRFSHKELIPAQISLPASWA